MPEKQIRELLKKYLEGQATPEDEKLIDEWYESLSATDQKSLSEAERARLRNAYWSAIQSDIHAQSKHRNLWPRAMAIAASVSVVLMLTVYALWPGTVGRLADVAAAYERTKVIENHTDDIMIALLPDSSRVELFPNSKISFDDDFGTIERRVRLTGQGFFEVSHDAEKPFYVFTEEVVTRVLGTSFLMTAYPDSDEITVAVSTGKVSVYTRTEDDLLLSAQDHIVLTPNQQVIYTKRDQSMSRTLVKEPRPIISDSESIMVRFEGAPVSEVFAALEEVYQIDIEFDSAVFDGCSITTTLSGEDMFERVDVICEVIGASYEVTGTTILISGAGCD